MAAKCPQCQSDQFFYVQLVREYHTIEAMPTPNEYGQYGYVEFVSLEDTRTDDDFEPYLKCNGCGVKLDMKGHIQD